MIFHAIFLSIFRVKYLSDFSFSFLTTFLGSILTSIFESIFNEATKARLNEEVIGINKAGIEVNLNGWQVANENFPQGGAPAEFDTEAEARASGLLYYLYNFL